MGNQSNKIYINGLRTIAILLVLLHHSLKYAAGTSLAYTWLIWNAINLNTSLFLFVSGYLFEQNKTKYRDIGKKEFIKKKTKRLLIPYTFWSFLAYSAISILFLIPESESILSGQGQNRIHMFTWIGSLFTLEDLYVDHLWYIYVLFLIFLISIFKNSIGLIDIIISVLIALFVGEFTSLPPVFTYFFSSYPIFLFGRWYKFNEKTLDVKWLLLAIPTGIAYAFCCNYFSGYWGLVTAALNYLLKIFLVACVVIFSGLLVKSKHIVTVMDYIGKRSMYIYLMHNPYFTAPVAIMFSRVRAPGFVIVICAIIVSVIGPICVAYFIKRVSSRFGKIIFGEN